MEENEDDNKEALGEDNGDSNDNFEVNGDIGDDVDEENQRSQPPRLLSIFRNFQFPQYLQSLPYQYQMKMRLRKVKMRMIAT